MLVYFPETATDYEAGIKSDFLDHRLRTNLAAYHTDYGNKQETIIVIINNAPATTQEPRMFGVSFRKTFGSE